MAGHNWSYLPDSPAPLCQRYPTSRGMDEYFDHADLNRHMANIFQFLFSIIIRNQLTRNMAPLMSIDTTRTPPGKVNI